MAKETEEIPKEIWKQFLKKHRTIALVAIAGIIGAFISAVYVFLWRATGTEAVTRYPPTLDLWTVGFVITLVIDLILWEILLIGIPVIAGIIILYMLWWKKLPADEQQAINISPRGKNPQKKGKRRSGSGAFNFLVTITWLIIIFVNGMWDTAFKLWSFTYLINSLISAFLWDLLILGIPAAIALTWWLRREFK